MSTDNKETTKSYEIFITMFSALFLLYLTYKYVYSQMLAGGDTDYYAHVYSLISMFRGENPLQGWMSSPHCLWHLTVLFFFKLLNIPLGISAALATCIYTAFYYFTLIWFIKKITKRFTVILPSIMINLLAFAFCMVQSLYLPFLDAGERYLGVFSMNPLHNPTHMCVRPFALVAFCLVIDIVAYSAGESYKPIFFDVVNSGKKYYLILTVVLFLSVVMKPTFAEMFIPAVGLYMLGLQIAKIIKRDNPLKFLKKLAVLFLCAVPALIYIALQYAVFFLMGGSYNNEGGIIVTKYLEVWSLFTDNVYLSILLGMAFPIYMLIINTRYFIGTTQGRIALIGYGVGFLEAAFLGESGSRLVHANFMWPMMSGMLIMWLVAFWRLIELSFVNVNFRSLIKEDGTVSVRRILLAGAWTLFIFHFLYGISFYSISLAGL